METSRTPHEALEAALKIAFGGSSTLAANELGVSYQTVNLWRKGERDGRPVRLPPEYAPVLDRLTNGQVRCEELCPGVDWPYLRAQAGECDCEHKAA